MKWLIALGWGEVGLCMNTVEEGKDRVSSDGETARCRLGPLGRQAFLSVGC